MTPFGHLQEASSLPVIKTWDNYPSITATEMRQLDILVFSRQLDHSPKYRDEAIIASIHNYRVLGTCPKIIFDIDDYWVIPKAHHEYDRYKRENVTDRTITALKLADEVWVPTKQLASLVAPYAKSVRVVPNAIDTSHPQWTTIKHPDPFNRMRFGYTGGAHHRADFKLLGPAFDKLLITPAVAGKYQLVNCGYNNTSAEEYQERERIMTSGYRMIKDDWYATYLMTRAFSLDHMVGAQPYIRKWALPISSYGTFYQHFEVSLVPMVHDNFTIGKSELKLIEAGFTKTAAIVSHAGPYRPVVSDKIAYVAKDKFDFYKYMKRAIQNPEEVKDKAEALHEWAVKNYSIEQVNRIRYNAMNELMTDKWAQRSA